MSKHNTKTMIVGIKNLLKKNYGIEGDIIDLETEVDETLTFEENLNKIKRKYVKMKLIDREDKK